MWPANIPLSVFLTPVILQNSAPYGDKKAALHAGFAEILPEGVTILAEVIEWPGEIDENRAKSAMERAEQRLQGKTADTDVARAETALQRAIARIQVLKNG